MLHQMTQQNDLPKEGREFMLLPHPNDEKHYAVRVLDGPYTGIEFAYSEVKLTEHVSGEFASLQFNYDVLKSPEDIITCEEDFQRWAGDILNSLLSNAFPEEVELKDENGNDPRADDPEAFGSIGSVHKDGNSVP